MAILTVHELLKQFGDDVIIKDVTFEVQNGDRIGLVGINGSGKTTLLKTITGLYSPDGGSFAYSKETTLGYMEQHVCRDLDKTAFEEVCTVFAYLTDIELELNHLSQALLHPGSDEEQDQMILRQAELHDQFMLLDGMTYQSRVRSTLMGLGFAAEQIENRVEVLSGGQKAKLQLAKMLLSQANLLLLDEPTNHLDIDSVEWLEDFLLDYNGAYLVISHDRYFLDKVTNKTIEMEYLTATSYPGGYSKFQNLKAEKRLTMVRAYESTTKEIKRIEGIIEQQKRFNQARNYVTIASKQKQIDRLAATLEKPGSDPKKMRFDFQTSRRSGEEVLMTENLSLAFDELSIFEHVDIDIRRGEKVFLLGPNGCGKTSLLKIILGIYMQNSGKIKLGAAVDIGYYQQSQSGLDESKTVIDEIWDLHPRMNMTEVRSALAIFLFQREDVFKPVSALSGGERARLLLLKLMLSNTNFLLLDEPSNHLDMDACETLETTLSDYEGTLFVVSHDRYLINKLADRIYYMEPDGIKSYLGNYDAFLESRADESAKKTGATSLNRKETRPQANLYKKKKGLDAKIRKKRLALSNCEKEIEEAESRIAEIENMLTSEKTSADYEVVMQLTEEMHHLHDRSETLLNKWTVLTEWTENVKTT